MTALPSASASIVQESIRRDTLAESVAVMLAITVVQRLVGFVRGFLFCDWLDPQQLGEWDISFSFLMLAAPLATLGLPNTFGRYLEHYRQQRQLRTFLQRVSTGMFVAATLFIVGLVMFAPWASQIVFGRPDQTTEIAILAGALVVIVAHHYAENLLMALRVYRLVSVVHFVQSVAFAVAALCLLAYWQRSASSIVVGYALGSCLSGAFAFVWLRRSVGVLETPMQRPAHREFWARLLQYAAWSWMASLMTNLFALVDRTMIIHCAGLSPEEAFTQVGNYHSSRVVPLLLVSIATLLGGMLMPHLSHDWETGRRHQVGQRLNFFLKLASLGLTAGGVAVLVASPLLFGWLLHGKYDGGLAVLPGTLTYCTWYGLMLIAQNYVFCAEKSRLASLALVVGLFTNVLLNFWWLPPLGLQGAVLATVVANLVTLLLMYVFSWSHGMQFDRGMLAMSMLPALLCLGAIPTALGWILTLFACCCTTWLMTAEEKSQIACGFAQLLRRVWPHWKHKSSAAST